MRPGLRMLALGLLFATGAALPAAGQSLPSASTINGTNTAIAPAPGSPATRSGAIATGSATGSAGAAPSTRSQTTPLPTIRVPDWLICPHGEIEITAGTTLACAP